MPITIENPTAEAICAALQNVPAHELARLREMLAPPINRNTQWSDEDLTDFANAGAALYEEVETKDSQIRSWKSSASCSHCPLFWQ